MAGGKREGAGRPKGAKDKSPRIKRADVLNARREQWDNWESQVGALKKVRKVLLEIVEDKDVSARDRIAAASIIETRGLGKPTEEREQLPQQTLVIIRPDQVAQLADPMVIEGEVTVLDDA